MIEIYTNYEAQRHFIDVLNSGGGLAEFLRYYEGDFIAFMADTEQRISDFAYGWGNVLEVHQQLKHHPATNVFITEWILEHPYYLKKYYDVHALFEVMSLIPVDLLVPVLNKYKTMIGILSISQGNHQTSLCH